MSIQPKKHKNECVRKENVDFFSKTSKIGNAAMCGKSGEFPNEEVHFKFNRFIKQKIYAQRESLLRELRISRVFTITRFAVLHRCEYNLLIINSAKFLRISTSAVRNTSLT